MKFIPAVTPLRLSALSLALLAAGCGSLGDGLFSNEKVDYRSAPVSSKPLEVPPDLSQLVRESRYQTQGGVVSAAAAGSAAAATPAATGASAPVALAGIDSMRVERDGQQRWLVVPQPAEQLWPQVKAFWEQRGFTLETDNAQAGVMETNWSENRAKLPADVLRRTLGSLIGSVYDSGERDRYRTRLERTTAGTEIYVTHRGLAEVFNEARDNTVWRTRPGDPQLEAEMLSRLMLALASKDTLARMTGPAAAAASAAVAAAAPAQGAVRVSAGSTPTSLVVEEPFDRAWRRVGLALDRSGFSVEDRDRAAGLYYVRYIDPKSAGKEEPGWWDKLFGKGDNPLATQRFRVAVKAAGNQTNVTIQKTTGEADTGENAKQIAERLLKDLR